jgi:hypothetical protein
MVKEIHLSLLNVVIHPIKAIVCFRPPKGLLHMDIKRNLFSRKGFMKIIPAFKRETLKILLKIIVRRSRTICNQTKISKSLQELNK